MVVVPDVDTHFESVAIKIVLTAVVYEAKVPVTDWVSVTVVFACTFATGPFVPTVTEVVPDPVMAAGNEPSLLPLNSLTAAESDAASFFIAVFLAFRCRAGTAKKTISRIKPAIASTIMTSMMVKPSSFFTDFNLLS